MSLEADPASRLWSLKDRPPSARPSPPPLEPHTKLRSAAWAARKARAAALTRWIGRTWITEGDLDAAEDCFAASLEIAAAHESLSDQAHALNLGGIAQFHRGAIDQAVEAFDRSQAIGIMSTGMRGHFDPALFETFCRITDPRFRAADAAGDTRGRGVIAA